MMKTIGTMAKALLIAAFAAAGGCASINISRVGKVMVDVENTNWLLFNFIPIASGNPERPNESDCQFFCDTVNLENNIAMVNYAVEKHGAVGVRDIISYTTDEYVLFILLKHHCMHTSAELVMPGDETRQGEVQRVEILQIKQEKLAEEPAHGRKETIEPPPKPIDDPDKGIKILSF